MKKKLVLVAALALVAAGGFYLLGCAGYEGESLEAQEKRAVELVADLDVRVTSLEDDLRAEDQLLRADIDALADLDMRVVSIDEDLRAEDQLLQALLQADIEALILALWDDNENGRITCAEAEAHGIAPVDRAHPAYRFMNDADDDGTVCE